MRIGSSFAIVLVGVLVSGAPLVDAQEVEAGRRPNVLDKILIQDLPPAQPRLRGAGFVVADAKKVDPEQAQLHAKFKKLLTGAKLTGQFTVDGKPLNDLTEETYEIEKVEKMAEGDMWVITARIKYGKNDLTFPIPLEVKWAGTTPVLTLDNMTIPGMGTFGARVVFHKDKYAGTWQHDNVGGHLFGLIQLAEERAAAEETPAK